MSDDLFDLFCDGAEETLIHRATTADGTNVAVIQLMYHVALYVNPTSVAMQFDYEERYCYHNLNAALQAIAFFEHVGIWVFWQKHHNKQISNVNGYLYDQKSTLHIPKHAIGMAGWSSDEVKKGIFRYYYFEVSENKDRLWVHSSDGSTVGRFCKRGVDIHTTVTEQLAGASECRHCTHVKPDASEWGNFKKLASELWYVAIPDAAIDSSVIS